jgi:hypothetical protein
VTRVCYALLQASTIIFFDFFNLLYRFWTVLISTIYCFFIIFINQSLYQFLWQFVTFGKAIYLTIENYPKFIQNLFILITQWCSKHNASFRSFVVLLTLWSINLYLFATSMIVFDATSNPVIDTSKLGFCPDLDNII